MKIIYFKISKKIKRKITVRPRKMHFVPERLSQQVKYVTKKACYYQSSMLFFMKAREMHTFILYGAFDYHAEMMIIVN